MITIHFRRCLFYYLRILIVVFFCLWFILIVFDRFFLGPELTVSSVVPFYTPCVFINDSSRCYSNVTGPSISTQFAPFVELRPYHLKSIHLALFWTPYFSLDALTQKRKSFLGDLFNPSFKANSDLNSAIFYRPRLCYQQYPRCLITTNRAYQSHAKTIIFHWRDIKINDLPRSRSPSQLWTLYNLEAPPNTRRLPENAESLLFNMTATYRLSSGIKVPYGKVIPRNGAPKTVNDLTRDDMGMYAKKTKPIAWFVSNCNTQSHREDFVKQLARHIEVDIYGRCGTFYCQPANSRKCYLEVAEKYFFYLSFENSICKDYVTEKLFSILNYDIIPVVFGGANYSQILPPHSYIDATEMKPHDLATLLHRIASDHREYLKYFEWKQHFRLELGGYNEALYCDLCRKMEEGDPVGEHSMTAKQINDWYFENTCNQRKVQFF